MAQQYDRDRKPHQDEKRAYKRQYRRSEHMEIDVKVSSNGRNWEKVQAVDLSSGGIRFMTSKIYALNANMRFDITVYNFLAEFGFKVQGEIKSVNKDEENIYRYGVQFLDLDENTKIRIDENVINDRPLGKHPYDSDE